MSKLGFDLNRAKKYLPFFELLDDKGNLVGYVFCMPRNPTPGAVLRVGGVDRRRVGLRVNHIIEMGGKYQPIGKTWLRRKPQENPQQLYFEEIFTQAPYDETSHLKPNGKRRR